MIAFCPKCGDRVRADPLPHCERGRMSFSPHLRRALDELFPVAAAVEDARPRQPIGAGVWYCPGCGGKLGESMDCAGCGKSLEPFLHDLVERHPHWDETQRMWR